MSDIFDKIGGALSRIVTVPDFFPRKRYKRITSRATYRLSARSNQILPATRQRMRLQLKIIGASAAVKFVKNAGDNLVSLLGAGL